VLEREEVDRRAFNGDYGEWDVTVWLSQRSLSEQHLWWAESPTSPRRSITQTPATRISSMVSPKTS
jgi:hypothetical protein